MRMFNFTRRSVDTFITALRVLGDPRYEAWVRVIFSIPGYSVVIVRNRPRKREVRDVGTNSGSGGSHS